MRTIHLKAVVWLHSKKAKHIGEVVLAAALLGGGLATMAHAGTDTTFTTSVTNLTSWTSGSLGKLAAVASLGVGVVGAVLRFDWKLIAGAVGIGLAASTGPAIVSGLMTATF